LALALVHGSTLSGFEQLDRIPGRIVDQHLPPARPLDRLAARLAAGGDCLGQRRVEVSGFDDDAVPAAGLRQRTIGELLARRRARPGQPQPLRLITANGGPQRSARRKPSAR
jgi:hypothetical protein